MKAIGAGAIAQACGGELVRGPAEVLVQRVCTDSRSIVSGDLFVALRGPRFDGHDFVDEARQKGARAALVERGSLNRVPEAPGFAVISVDDSLQALQRLAGWYRRQLGAQVVAVTGSVGKTSTKEMAAAIFSRARITVKAPASFNNEVGVPLTVLAADDRTQVLVLEIAMRGPGQIRRLCAVAQPTVGIVTNVGESHVGLLGSLEAVARAKAELVESLPPGGVAVLNADDERVRAMAALAPEGVRVVTFGIREPADVRAEKIRGGGLGGTRFDLAFGVERAECHLALPGRHMVANAAAAAAAALACGLSLDAVVQGLATFTGASMRMEVETTPSGLVILNDAYNASPASMRAALETLETIAAEGRHRAVAVLGDMLELGDHASEAHRAVGREAARRGVDLLIAVGDMADLMAAGAREGGAGSEMTVIQVADAEHAAAVARRHVRPGDAVLVKASRAVGLEAVVRALRQAGGDGPP